jgi:hypothetical protein
VVATKRQDGEIALNPVWFEYRDGRFSLNSYQLAMWPRGVQRQRGATLLVIDPVDTLRTATSARTWSACGARARASTSTRSQIGTWAIHTAAPTRIG